jgi:prepilin-type N-terminal cleavage/methylation domain-containing protein
MKKGFTIVELVISIGLLSIILVAVSSIFITAIKNYQIGFARSSIQKEINFSVDDINKNIKLAVEVPTAYPATGETLGGNTLILALPSITNQGAFIYQGGILQKDYFIYTLSSGALHKKVYSTAGVRANQNNSDNVIISYVLNTNASPIFSYFPDAVTARQVQINLKSGRTVEKTNVAITGSRLADLRNKD